MDCSTRFVNFSDAGCAIDSTAILFYKPKEETEQKIILQVLADRGYVGIESYHKSAIVQQRRLGKETINRNNNITANRQIVEGTLEDSMKCGEIMNDCYRGDRRAIPQLIRGLVTLTNYYIDQHPLGEGDELHDPRRFSVPRPKAPSQ